MSEHMNTPAMAPGEFWDKWTIALRKYLILPESNDTQANILTLSLSIPDKVSKDALPMIVELMMVNTDIWNMESQVRRGKEKELGYEEVGKRALEIRNRNNRRVMIINSLNELYGHTIKEVKTDHASS